MNMLVSIATRGRFAAGITAIAALTGCMITPGKFDASMTVMKDGGFGFDYDGEIYMLALSDLADLANRAENVEFEPECLDDDFEERPCTEEEIAEQRTEWEDGRENRQAEAEQQAAAMRAMLGGIDPNDPEAANELAAKLERQAGWDKVSYLGAGLFDVEFSVRSQLGHDFAFPLIEGLPLPNLFVLANRRDGGIVRIDAPGFAPQSGVSPFGGMMAGMAGAMAAADEGETKAPPHIPEIDGTFRILTDGAILANNTDEGPQDSVGGSILTWRVDARTTAAPTALIRLDE